MHGKRNMQGIMRYMRHPWTQKTYKIYIKICLINQGMFIKWRFSLNVFQHKLDMIDISCVFAFCVFAIVLMLESGFLFFWYFFSFQKFNLFSKLQLSHYDVYKKTILQNHNNFSQTSIAKNEKTSQRRFYRAYRRIIQPKNKPILKFK